MIDLSNVKSLVIPEGKVVKIVHGDISIWEEPSVSAAIVIYPATEEGSSIIGGSTYLNSALSISREISVTEKYIFYINNISHPVTPEQTASASAQLSLVSDDGYVQISSASDDYHDIFVRIMDELASPVLIEIHYIPE